MDRNRDKAIELSWDIHDDEGVSTPRLLQMVADDNGCDTSDVIDAMVRLGRLHPSKRTQP